MTDLGFVAGLAVIAVFAIVGTFGALLSIKWYWAIQTEKARGDIEIKKIKAQTDAGQPK